MFKLKAIILLMPSFAMASNYLSVINKDHNEYDVVISYTDTVIYSPWVGTEEYNCNVDTNPEDHYYNLDFTQTTTCDEKETRTATTERTYIDGKKEVIDVKTETRYEPAPDQTVVQTLKGVHLEESCNDIITKGWASSDGAYTIGVDNDSFSVYCDMRGSDGWTLIAKSPGGDSSGPSITQDWFVNGYNQADITNTNYTYNGNKSAIGLSYIEKMNHTGLVEVQFISEDMTQNVSFYKTAINSNMEHWFKTTEPTATTVCTDKEMTQQCESSAFEFWSGRYWLRGMDLTKHGFNIIDTVVQDIHYNFPSPTTVSSTMCSVTGNLDNNAWRDSAVDGHWGNGMVIYIK